MNTPSNPVLRTDQSSPSINNRKGIWRSWIRLIVVPCIAIGVIVGTFFAIGTAQRNGWITKYEGVSGDLSGKTEGVRYICPMMCVPPADEPGRCPVCEMELVAAETGPVFIDPATRRILNIQTTKATKGTLNQEIRSVGELTYDESRLKTISAYVDGRIEKLFANFTGVVVSQGEPLAIVYSPDLFVAQKELLMARTTRLRTSQSVDGLYDRSRQRLIELGMTSNQIDALEQSGETNSRLELVAPMSGTVIEKLAVEGQYINQGDPIYQLANLSQVWLMLKLFPEDAALVTVGQVVEAEIDSLPGRRIEGKVAFVFPNIDPLSRTVSVRVVVPNSDGLLRIGDFARATVAVPVGSMAGDMTAMKRSESEMMVVPRDAVLIVGQKSVVYVESEPGRFEMRNVTIGSISQREVSIVSGLKEGESIARRGNFLIDSQMQLAGNPSLIDPSKAEPRAFEDEMTAEMEEAFAELSPADRELAMNQKLCVVADMPLGSMGVPIRVEVEGKAVFICCEGCRKPLLNDPPKYLGKLNN